uniref:Hypothetical_protein n=1 Tax=Oryza brachyantha TaxID=4533 RepID=G2XMJ3_ORYBR|nr:hypothetical_protein [Oryza brachyantha]
MDAVAFPPPPAPFLDDDLDFGDFAFAEPHPPRPAFDDDWGDFVATSALDSDPDGPTTTTATAKPSTWEKPRGPLPLSLFGAGDDDDDDEEEEVVVANEGPAEPPTAAAAAHQREPRAISNGSSPADLKDLIAGLYGSQPLSSPGAAEAGAQEMVAVDDDGFGDDGWEFKAAPSSDGAEIGSRQAHGDGVEDVRKSMGSDQEDWSLFTSVDENLNHVQTTNHIETHEATEQSVKVFSWSSPNNAAILDLYKETKLVDVVHMTQNSSESVQDYSDMFSNNEMNSSCETDENHSIKSTSNWTLIDFYRKLREESLTVIFQYRKSFKEHTAKDACISELLDHAKEVYLKDFEEEYHLTERIAMALEDMSSAVELYKHRMSILYTLEQSSKEEQCDYIHTWYSMLMFCAQELQHGVVLWQESCGRFFIALGEIYRVAQILNLSLQSFKPWVLATPGMLSKMMVCWDGCMNAWTNCLGTALRMVVDSNNLDAPVAKVVLESIININKIEVASLRFLPNSKMTCRLTLLPTNLVPGMEVIIWDGDHYFVKVANLWANRISSDPPQFSVIRTTC